MARIGQLEVRTSGDLVAVLHREPVTDPVAMTFKGFEDRAHWTQMTPANARRLAAALTVEADRLDALAAAQVAA